MGPRVYQLDLRSHVYLARNLAKRGLNRVRLYGAIYGARDPAVHSKRLDDGRRHTAPTIGAQP